MNIQMEKAWSKAWERDTELPYPLQVHTLTSLGALPTLSLWFLWGLLP